MTQRNEERDAVVAIEKLKAAVKKPLASANFAPMKIDTNPFPEEERLDVAQYERDLESIRGLFDTETLFDLAIAAVNVFEVAQQQKKPSAKIRRALEHPLTKTAVNTLKTALPQYGAIADLGLSLAKEALPQSPSDDEVGDLEAKFQAAWKCALGGKDLPEA